MRINNGIQRIQQSFPVRLLGAAFVAGLFCGMTGTGLGPVIGNFETGTLDGWGSDGGPGSPTLSQSTTGATLGSFALQSATAQGGFWGPATGNLIGEGFGGALQGATTLSYDLTLNNSALNGGTAGFNGFAQDNELAITLFGNAGALNLFIQANWSAAGISDSSGQSAGWNGLDGTRHLVWDLTKFTAVDPADSQTETVAQILAHNPGITDAKIAFVEQTGNATASVGPAVFYFDNVQLNGVPEPTMAALVLLGGCLMPIARRWRRS